MFKVKICIILVISILIIYIPFNLVYAENKEIKNIQNSIEIITKDKNIEFNGDKTIGNKLNYFYKNNKYMYCVDSKEATIKTICRLKNTKKKSKKLEINTLKNLTKKHIKTYRSDLNISNFRMKKNDVIDTGPSIENVAIWKEYNKNGILTGNSVSVTIDSDGELISFAVHESKKLEKTNVNEITKYKRDSIIKKNIQEKYKKLCGRKINLDGDKIIFNYEKTNFNGKLAWKVIVSNVPDFVFSDITMEFLYYIDCEKGEILFEDRTK